MLHFGNICATVRFSQLVLVACIFSVSSGLRLQSGRERLSLSDEPEPSGAPIHVLLGRALFDFQDHVERISAIRETWARPGRGFQIHVMNFGKDRFDNVYHNWCTELSNCPTDKYAEAPDEMQIPGDVLLSPLWNLDGHVWGMQQAMQDPAMEWVLLGQDMLYVHEKNMQAYLKQFDHNQHVVIGNRLHGQRTGKENEAEPVMGSPWGYFISRSAVESLIEGWTNGGLRANIASDEYLSNLGGSTDYAFGNCLMNMEPPAKFMDTRDVEGRDRLYLWPPSRMDRNDWWDSWYPSMRIEPPEKRLSPESFLFFFAGPREIRELDAFFEFPGDLKEFMGKASIFYHESTWQMLDAVRNKNRMRGS